MPWSQSVCPPEGMGKPEEWRMDKRDSMVYACACTNI